MDLQSPVESQTSPEQHDSHTLPGTVHDLIDDLQVTSTPLLTHQEKMDYFGEFDTIPGVSTKAEELASQLSALPWKIVPKELGNNYVVGFPGLNDAQKKLFIQDLAEIFGHQNFLTEFDKLPHFKNIFLFTLPQHGGNIPEHHHHQEARLFILDGSATDIYGNKVKSGGMVTNIPNERHAYVTDLGEKLLAISRGADDGILDFNKETGEFIGIHDFVH